MVIVSVESKEKPTVRALGMLMEISKKIMQIMDPNLHPRGKGLHDMGTNPCASETSDLELSNAQGFESISLTVASEYSIENP